MFGKLNFFLPCAQIPINIFGQNLHERENKLFLRLEETHSPLRQTNGLAGQLNFLAALSGVSRTKAVKPMGVGAACDLPGAASSLMPINFPSFGRCHVQVTIVHRRPRGTSGRVLQSDGGGPPTRDLQWAWACQWVGISPPKNFMVEDMMCQLELCTQRSHCRLWLRLGL